MFKLLPNITEDFADSADAAVRGFGNSVMSGFNKGMSQADTETKEKTRDAEKQQKVSDAENSRISGIKNVSDVLAIMEGGLVGDAELLGVDDEFVDPEWHNLSAKDLQYVRKQADKIQALVTEFKKQYKRAMKGASFLDVADRKQADVLLDTVDDTRTLDGLKALIAQGDNFADLFKNGNVPKAVSKAVDFVAKIIERAKNAPVMTAPANSELVVKTQGAALQRLTNRIDALIPALDKLEFGQVGQRANGESTEPQTESRKLVGFRALTLEESK